MHKTPLGIGISGFFHPVVVPHLFKGQGTPQRLGRLALGGYDVATMKLIVRSTYRERRRREYVLYI